MTSEPDDKRADGESDEDDERGKASLQGDSGSGLTRADDAESGPPEDLPNTLFTASWARAHAIHLAVGAVALFMIVTGLVDMLTK